MNHLLLSSEVQNFINENLNADITKLAFKGSPFKAVTVQELMQQIISKNKCIEKLPTWFKTPLIYYPNKINIEQSSSEITGHYKASLITGNTLLDLTGGLGVDSYCFSKTFKKVTHCEMNPELTEIAHYNFKLLDTTNIDNINNDGLNYLKKSDNQWDWIYIDPSRRDNHNSKVFKLNDCIPDVPNHLSQLFEHSHHLLIKVAPFLDIHQGINELQFVKEVHIVAVDNEVKELLFILIKNYTEVITIKTINITKQSHQTFNFVLDAVKKTVTYCNPLLYLYEPNNAILKSGAFNLIADEYKLNKLAPNTHLYTSANLIDFPGTTYEVLTQIPYNAQKLKSILPTLKAHIKIRNFPDTINSIKKKMKLNDGGFFYVFFTTIENEKPIVLLTKKLIK